MVDLHESGNHSPNGQTLGNVTRWIFPEEIAWAVSIPASHMKIDTKTKVGNTSQPAILITANIRIAKQIEYRTIRKRLSNPLVSPHHHTKPKMNIHLLIYTARHTSHTVMAEECNQSFFVASLLGWHRLAFPAIVYGRYYVHAGRVLPRREEIRPSMSSCLVIVERM